MNPMSRSIDSSPPSEPNDQIPSKLTEGFAELYPTVQVPASVDLAILNAARAHLAGQVHGGGRSMGSLRYRRVLRWAGTGAAVAAAAAAVLLVTLRPATPSGTPHAALAGDINGDNRVDVLDAYLVARTLADKTRPVSLPAAWDVNHDGVVDQKDVDWIAAAAVRVGNVPVAAGDSRLLKSAEVFELAQDLKSLEASANRSPAVLHRSAEAPAPLAFEANTGKGAAAQ